MFLLGCKEEGEAEDNTKPTFIRHQSAILHAQFLLATSGKLHALFYISHSLL